MALANKRNTFLKTYKKPRFQKRIVSNCNSRKIITLNFGYEYLYVQLKSKNKRYKYNTYFLLYTTNRIHTQFVIIMITHYY